MKDKIYISGFADEIASDFDEQLSTVANLGMKYICLRSADGKGIADFSLEQVKNNLLPRLQTAGIKVSSLGSPIGKIGIEDERGFNKQLAQLETLCAIAHLLECRYIRTFSFYIPKTEQPEKYRDQVLVRLSQMLSVAAKYGVVLINENEKELYGDIGSRCLDIMESVNSPFFRLAFDFANFVQSGEDTEICWNMLQDYIEYIHIKDAVSTNQENVLCGTGEGKIALLLHRAINLENYTGFLTLEPHLVLFDSLAMLETADPTEVIKVNKAKDGAEGFAMQYSALCEILGTILI